MRHRLCTRRLTFRSIMSAMIIPANTLAVRTDSTRRGDSVSVHNCCCTASRGTAEIRTPDPHHAIVVLCQLSYSPIPETG